MAATKTTPKIRDDYLSLVVRFPLVPIRSDRHLASAHRVIDELISGDEKKLSPGQRDYLLVLGDLSASYEADALAEMTRGVTGLDVLKQLVQEHDLTASDLGRILGQRELGSKVLNGLRRISRSHAQLLARRFGVPIDLFLR